jgi:hypothetical protein
MSDHPPLVLIEWVDSGQPIPGWQWLDALGARQPHRCVSVGFLVQDDEITKVIAPNLAASEGTGQWDQASGIITIPTVSVQKLERLTSYLTASVPDEVPVGDRVAA